MQTKLEELQELTDQAETLFKQSTNIDHKDALAQALVVGKITLEMTDNTEQDIDDALLILRQKIGLVMEDAVAPTQRSSELPIHKLTPEEEQELEDYRSGKILTPKE
jgi:hypothetical protein